MGASGSGEEPLCSQFFSAASLQICPHTQFLPSAHRKAVEIHKNTFLQRLPLHGLKPPRTFWLFKDFHGLTPKGPDTSWDQFNSRLYHQIMMSLCTQCAKQPQTRPVKGDFPEEPRIQQENTDKYQMKS